MQKQIDELRAEIASLKSASEIPYEVEQAIRTRFKLHLFATISNSDKTTNSENQAVNEGGAATYSVLGVPDDWIQTTIGSTTYYIPVWTS